MDCCCIEASFDSEKGSIVVRNWNSFVHFDFGFSYGSFSHMLNYCFELCSLSGQSSSTLDRSLASLLLLVVLTLLTFYHCHSELLRFKFGFINQI